MSKPPLSIAPEPTPFERMQALATRVMAVPKSEVDRREREWKQARLDKKRKNST